jgi:hypothetical protein
MNAPARDAAACAAVVARAAWAVALAAALAAPPAAHAAEVYRNDFQLGAGPEWSNTTLSATPLPSDGSRKFLGRFDNQDVRLTLSGLAVHSSVTIDFDFYANGTWDGVDGSGLGYGPDFWTAAVVGGPTLLHTTFSNVTSPPFGIPFLQSFPDDYGGPTHPQFTGSVEQRTLGYFFSGYDVSAVYHLHYTVPHTASDITFSFTGFMATGYSGAHDINEESWGLDNVVVSTDATTGVQAFGKVALALQGASPNPAFGPEVDIQFDLPGGGDARLELLDVGGRRVAVREVGALGPGHHQVRLGAGTPLPRGIYFVRLSSGGRNLVRRVTVMG